MLVFCVWDTLHCFFTLLKASFDEPLILCLHLICKQALLSKVTWGTPQTMHHIRDNNHVLAAMFQASKSSNRAGNKVQKKRTLLMDGPLLFQSVKESNYYKLTFTLSKTHSCMQYSSDPQVRLAEVSVSNRPEHANHSVFSIISKSQLGEFNQGWS